MHDVDLARRKGGTTMPDSSFPVEIFCSYAHEDESLQQDLKKHLSALQRQGRISLWHDRLIAPGTDWSQAIDRHLNSASVILLLISSDFLASDYCYGIEMERALAREQAGEARVIPILLRPVDWAGMPFAHLQVLPTDAKPITSWHNRDEAFADVAAGIRRAIEDLSLQPASPLHTVLPPIWNIPYPHNLFFIGREDLLSRIHTQFQQGQATARSQPQAMSGLGGIGKTQIAVEYGYRFRQDYQAVLWARAETREVLISSYVALASLLKLRDRDAQDQQITVRAVKEWLQTYREWLLILDNADELSLLPEFLPPAPSGHLLLTTRAAALGGLAQRLEVEAFSIEEGSLFLLRRAGLLAPTAPLEQATTAEQEQAALITQELGGLPLTLDQAGAYLEETGASPAEYLQLYRDHRTELLNERRGLVADHPEPVATTWSLSFARIEERSQAAAYLLRLCAFLAPDAIPEEIITQGAPHVNATLAPLASDTFLLHQAIEVARAYSLVRRDPRTGTLSMHRLVQAVLRDAMSAKNAKQWMVWTVNAVNAAFPTAVKFDNWPLCDRCLPHALLCAHWIEQAQIDSTEAIHLLNEAGYYLTERGRYVEAEFLYRRGLVICERQLNAEDPRIAYILTNLGYLYIRQGKYLEAEPLLQRALAIQERQLGAQHLDTANTLESLASLYRNQGKYEEAEPFYQRVFAIRWQQLGIDHPFTAISLNNLALNYVEQGKDAEAESLLTKALQTFEQQQNTEQPNTAGSLNNLGQLYMRQGRYEEAEPLLKRSLEICEQILGQIHPHTLIARKIYGDFRQTRGEYPIHTSHWLYLCTCW
jgi:tetratricopeptide (TPR) repeat protein